MGDVLPMEDDRAGGWLVNARHHPRQGGFSAAGLAHQPNRLALRDVEVDAIDGVHDLPAAEEAGLGKREMLHHAAQLQHALAALELGAGSVVDAGLGLRWRCCSGRRRRQGIAGLRHPAARLAAGLQLDEVRVLGALGYAERAARGKPAPDAPRIGGAPSMVTSRRCPGTCRSMRGTALIRAQV